jgi:23S rRNA pseudouridine1911/1915/1917 synthase
VIDKPPDLQMHPSKPDGSFTLWHGLQEMLAFELVNGGQISIINRLDRETSGLTLICKNAKAARHFARLMQRRRIHKEYLAIVWGWLKDDSYEINAPIARQGKHCSSRIWIKRMVHPEGAPAQTNIAFVDWFEFRGDRFSLVRAIPLTGRMHQIRVHLAHLGHPIVGDKIYGSNEENYLEFIETGWTPKLEESLLLPRHALHSAVLAVPDEKLRWEADLPGDLGGFMEKRHATCEQTF